MTRDTGFYTVRQIAYRPDHQYLALAIGTDIDVRRLADVARVYVLPHRDVINALAFDPTGRLLASGTSSSDELGALACAVYLWDLQDGQRRAVRDDATAPITEVAFDHTGTWLAAGSVDHLLRVWSVGQLRTGRPDAGSAIARMSEVLQ